MSEPPSGDDTNHWLTLAVMLLFWAFIGLAAWIRRPISCRDPFGLVAQEWDNFSPVGRGFVWIFLLLMLFATVASLVRACSA